MVVPRVVNDLPVIGSQALIAMTSQSEVQRLRTQWPAFAMVPGDKLMAREEVLMQAALLYKSVEGRSSPFPDGLILRAR